MDTAFLKWILHMFYGYIIWIHIIRINMDTHNPNMDTKQWNGYQNTQWILKIKRIPKTHNGYQCSIWILVSIHNFSYGYFIIKMDNIYLKMLLDIQHVVWIPFGHFLFLWILYFYNGYFHMCLWILIKLSKKVSIRIKYPEK